MEVSEDFILKALALLKAQPVHVHVHTSPGAASAPGNDDDTSMDEYTRAKLKVYTDRIAALRRTAGAARLATAPTREMLADQVRKAHKGSLLQEMSAAESAAETDAPNKYSLQSRFTSKGILGTQAEPNDGSGKSLIAGKELITRLLSKSLMNNSGDVELLKLRSQDPVQPYPTLEKLSFDGDVHSGGPTVSRNYLADRITGMRPFRAASMLREVSSPVVSYARNLIAADPDIAPTDTKEELHTLDDMPEKHAEFDPAAVLSQTASHALTEGARQLLQNREQNKSFVRQHFTGPKPLFHGVGDAILKGVKEGPVARQAREAYQGFVHHGGAV